MASCCKLLGAGILCSCSCPCRSGHNAPINFQQDKCYFLFCNFLMDKCYTFKGQSLEKCAILYISAYRQHSFRKGAEPA